MCLSEPVPYPDADENAERSRKAWEAIRHKYPDAFLDLLPDTDAHAEDVWHVRYDGQDFRDG